MRFDPSFVSQKLKPVGILFTSEGGLGDFEKNILQVHMRKKKILAQDYCPKKFIHVQWAGKKILARCFLN